MMMGGDIGKPWGKDKKQSVMVFIGRKLPQGPVPRRPGAVLSLS